MIKDEENNLPRCLDSLKPLLKNSAVELIIVDTGSKDRSVEISKMYTDKIFYHQWDNNFSEMRNVSISYAKGEWIFIIDADEELVDGDSLLSLLQSNSIKKYKTIQLQMKDYPKSKEPERFMVYNSYRLFYNTSNFKYVGAVHNQPVIENPILMSNIVLNHYGYQFDNTEILERKFKRTAGILHSELEKEPDNIYYRFQLANSYYIHDDYKDALDQIRKGYEALLKLSKAEWNEYGYLFGEYARDSYVNQQFVECIEKCKEGLQLVPDYLDLYYYLSISYQAISDFEHAIEAAEKYFEIYNNFNELKISKDASIIMYTLDGGSKNTLHTLLSGQYYKLNDYGNCLKHTVHLRDSSLRIQTLIGIHIKLRKFRELAEFYQLMTADESNDKEYFIRMLEDRKDGLSKEEKIELYRYFAAGGEDYAVLNKIRIAEGSLGKMLCKEFILSTDFNDKELFYCEVFKSLERDQAEIFIAFKKIKSFKLRQIVKYLMDNYTIAEPFFVDYLKNANVRGTDFENLRVYSCIGNVIFLYKIESCKTENTPIPEEYVCLFGRYINKGISRVSIIYQFERMRLYYKGVEQEEDQFFILLAFAKQAADKKSKTALNYLKQAVEIYPYYSSILSGFTDNLFANLDGKENLDES